MMCELFGWKSIMKQRLQILLLALCTSILAASTLAGEPPTPAQEVAVHCGHLVDPAAGKLLGETTVVVEGKRIKEVKVGRVDVAGAQVVELGDATCLPGLIDSHTHLIPCRHTAPLQR